ncbi:short chain dehydrogenase [Anaerocolumna jejuensis DSM 15929]|uniref:Short chain dehydrogenase n=1 Tax=Anaerocolumna jejuensis DSM 15929 TaxID=1121322 RepID=A0A1M6Q1Q5_9FIRM|nr:SDR family NAD(P)-dependent oxidoreductase [Anaerocolumna jejuensis]SHK14134.1 short chain dehydrogenase [Anaerocolumna jejuensis DSM 15929]
MKTILVTGGTDGIGKGIAMHFLKKGDRVIVVGSSSAKGGVFYQEARQLGAEDRAIYIQANLSLVKENQRVIEEIKDRFHYLDIVVFCAAKHNKEYTETKEGFETTFALAYLSRFLLSYGLKDSLEKSASPVILNVCAPGMKGEVNWKDIQNRNNFEPQKVMFHGSRLNDLSGVSFAENDTAGKIKYILYNPWAVQTSSMLETFKNPLMKLIYKIIGKPVEKAIVPVIELLDNPPAASLSAFRERKAVSLAMETFNKENARKLYNMTLELRKKNRL